ncbi:MAG: hypothetical protein HQ538_01135 [Parcubacteria group bacterium]|nr:hypothetical protein [Parcubacteria group bacterium]
MAKEKTITELYDFLQKHMVTKDELNEKLETMASKEDLKKMELDLKDHVDEKLGELKGDLVILTKKEDKKLLFLVKILKDKNIIDDKDVKALLNMEPFPRPAL